MTAIPLHHMPRWRTVAGEQVRAVGLMTRLAGVALIATLAPLVVAVLRATIQQPNFAAARLLQLESAPWAAIFSIAAALFAISMWRQEDPDHRSYHWMMPVSPPVHSLTKVLAGWLWIVAAAVMTLAAIATLGAVSMAIADVPQPAGTFGWSFWIVPITSATIAYVLVSAATVGTRQPLLWVAGVVLVYSGLLLSLDVLGLRDTHRVVRMALTGEYGVTAAMFGDVDRLDTAQLRSVPSVGRWLGAFALWGGLGSLLLLATAFRRAESAVVGAHGPLRRAIIGNTWLVASVFVLAAAGGLVATRVMKPQYEARATIWNGPRTAGIERVTVSEQRTMNARELVDVLRSSRIADTVVQRLALFVRPDNVADTALLKTLTVANRFMPGDYHFAVADSGIRWMLTKEFAPYSDRGALGDSVGRPMGLVWLPAAATLKRYAGREVRFTIVSPREAAADLQSRLTAMTPANSSFLELRIADADPQRAARTLNAIAFAYVATTRDLTGGTLSVLDSAVTPLSPFKNSPAQLFGMSLAIGIAVAISLAFAMSAYEARMRRS